MFGMAGISGMEKFHEPSPGAITVVCRFSPTVAVWVCAAPRENRGGQRGESDRNVDKKNRSPSEAADQQAAYGRAKSGGGEEYDSGADRDVRCLAVLTEEQAQREWDHRSADQSDRKSVV